MKKGFILAASAAFVSLMVGAAVAQQRGGRVADINLGTRGMNVLASMNLRVYAVPDPLVRGVTCHVQTAEASGLTLASNPSNTSIACRQTGRMYAEDIARIPRGEQGQVIFSEDASGLDIFGRGSNLFRAISGAFKEINVRRIWDETSQTIIYVSFATRLIDGSPRASISTVTTYGQLAAAAN